MKDPFRCCTLCPRACGVDRTRGQRGRCGCDDRIRVGRVALHPWEEPCFTGAHGAGTVFFVGCSLGCVYCQNRKISGTGPGAPAVGEEYTPERLAEAFLRLQREGAANIDLVTPDHFMPKVDRAITIAKEEGLALPVICNCSGYEDPEALRAYYRQVDVFLTDFKYMDPDLAGRLSGARDYPEAAKAALEVMVELTVEPVFDGGLLRRGVLVRHLVLPGHKRNSRAVLDYLSAAYGERIWISILRQYTPPGHLRTDPAFRDIARPLTEREYQNVVDHALALGIENAYLQEGGAVGESFIPEFGE